MSVQSLFRKCSKPAKWVNREVSNIRNFSLLRHAGVLSVYCVLPIIRNLCPAP